MEKLPVKIKSIAHLTHDVLQIVTEKPSEVNFIPGQAADISINKPQWRDELRPFTFTSLPENNFLEFSIKTYPEHKSVTNELLSLKPDDELIIHGVFGAIHYKGEGTFIAGGAGVTPFISILRDLHSTNKLGNNKLIFANKCKADIIHLKEFNKMLGKNFINILSDEKSNEFAHGFITQDFLEKNLSERNKQFYLCGPPPMMDAIEKILSNMNISSDLIIKEAF